MPPLANSPSADPATTSRPVHPRAVTQRCHALRNQCEFVEASVVGTFLAPGGNCELPRIRLVGPYAGHDPIRLGIFAGIHGDEPAGVEALLQFAESLVRDPARMAGYDLVLYPLVNPTGYERGSRENFAGKDLNREFWRQSSQSEVKLIEAELRLHQFAGIITLHTDDTSEGVYGYAHGRTLNEALLTPALKAASEYLPLDGRGTIDGFPAQAGVIRSCFECVLSAPPEQRPKPFDLIFETPGHAPFGLQVSATLAALEAIVATYPGFIAYAQDL